MSANTLGYDADLSVRTNVRRMTSQMVDAVNAHDEISPTSDVFSYFMLTSPTERLKHGRFTLDACISYLLVFLTLVIQGILLYCVYDKVIHKNESWRNGILNTGNSWNLGAPSQDWTNFNFTAPPEDGCNDGNSLCYVHDGIYTCAPPSVQLIGRWHELDLDGDGIWTREEVIKNREELQCKYAVDPLEFFHVLIAMLKERKDIIWLHPDVRSSKALHKDYFTYALGDIAMCGYRNADMCGNLIKNGIFDVPIKAGNVKRIGGSISSALSYCQDLLAPRGLCERILPSTYSTWKIESVQECKAAEYSKFVKEDPSDGSFKSLLTVDYEARQGYEMAQKPIFMAYKCCILFLWNMLVISQLREVGKIMAWVISMPSKSSHDEEDEERARNSPAHASQIEIHSISIGHRVVLLLSTAARVVMLCVLFYVGVTFLSRQLDYIGLLLDGVALLFVVDIAEIIYAKVLRQEVRTNWEEASPIFIKKLGIPCLSQRPDCVDLIWLLVPLIMSICFLYHHTNDMVVPLYDALECTCLGQGESCHEAHVFSKSFWDQYWSHDGLAAIQGIEAMKTQMKAGAVEFRDEFANNLKFGVARTISHIKEVHAHHNGS